MDKNLKVNWISRLRGGQYAQGRGFLRRRLDNENSYAYCCLGVLCDAIDPTAWADDAWRAPHDEVVVTRLSSMVLTAVGMSRDQEDKLLDLNDCDGESFSKIADWIEENL